MRTLFTFSLVLAIAFSSVAVGQEETIQTGEIPLEAAETLDDTPASIVDLEEAAPSDAEIDTARAENAASIDSAATTTTAYNQFLDQGVTYPENIAIQECDCQSGMIAPVIYQSPLLEGVVEGASEMVEGSVAAEPIADAASVVESPIADSAPIYADTGMITEGSPINPMGTSTPSCGCNQGAAPAALPTEGLISSPAVSYPSAPVMYSSPAPAAAPCCTPARRGFFRTLFGR